MTKAERLFLGLVDTCISLQNPLNRTAKQPTAMSEFAIKQAAVRNILGDYCFGFVDCSNINPETARELTAITLCI